MEFIMYSLPYDNNVPDFLEQKLIGQNHLKLQPVELSEPEFLISEPAKSFHSWLLISEPIKNPLKIEPLMLTSVKPLKARPLLLL